MKKKHFTLGRMKYRVFKCKLAKDIQLRFCSGATEAIFEPICLRYGLTNIERKAVFPISRNMQFSQLDSPELKCQFNTDRRSYITHLGSDASQQVIF
jgi:hypothetical protein